MPECSYVHRLCQARASCSAESQSIRGGVGRGVCFVCTSIIGVLLTGRLLLPQQPLLWQVQSRRQLPGLQCCGRAFQKQLQVCSGCHSILTHPFCGELSRLVPGYQYIGWALAIPGSHCGARRDDKAGVPRWNFCAWVLPGRETQEACKQKSNRSMGQVSLRSGFVSKSVCGNSQFVKARMPAFREVLGAPSASLSFA